MAWKTSESLLAAFFSSIICYTFFEREIYWVLTSFTLFYPGWEELTFPSYTRSVSWMEAFIICIRSKAYRSAAWHVIHNTPSFLGNETKDSVARNKALHCATSIDPFPFFSPFLLSDSFFFFFFNVQCKFKLPYGGILNILFCRQNFNLD